MTAVYKFPILHQVETLPNHITIKKFLAIQLQHGVPVVWAIVDPNTPDSTTWTITEIGTGWNFQRDLSETGEYIGTIQDGDYVWHYFADNIALIQ